MVPNRRLKRNSNEFVGNVYVEKTIATLYFLIHAVKMGP